jgi:hypothetical protein
MRIFGLELGRLVTLREDRGVRIAGNDFLISADRMLPAPRIQGRVTGMRLERGRMILTFTSPGEAAKAPLSPPDRSSHNYMYYRGGILAFGKLTMRDAELEIVDANPRDPFDFFLDHYNDQLVASYDENLPDGGLIVHMPDYSSLRTSPGSAPPPSLPRETSRAATGGETGQSPQSGQPRKGMAAAGRGWASPSSLAQEPPRACQR